MRASAIRSSRRTTGNISPRPTIAQGISQVAISAVSETRPSTPVPAALETSNSNLPHLFDDFNIATSSSVEGLDQGSARLPNHQEVIQTIDSSWGRQRIRQVYLHILSRTSQASGAASMTSSTGEIDLDGGSTARHVRAPVLRALTSIPSRPPGDGRDVEVPDDGI